MRPSHALSGIRPRAIHPLTLGARKPHLRANAIVPPWRSTSCLIFAELVMRRVAPLNESSQKLKADV